mgnify:CR=1 FL=1
MNLKLLYLGWGKPTTNLISLYCFFIFISSWGKSSHLTIFKGVIRAQTGGTVAMTAPYTVTELVEI